MGHGRGSGQHRDHRHDAGRDQERRSKRGASSQKNRVRPKGTNDNNNNNHNNDAAVADDDDNDNGSHKPGGLQQKPPAAPLAVAYKTVTPPLAEPVPEDTPRFADMVSVHPSLVEAITEDLKFDHMMPVQAASLEELLPPNRSDCLVQAKTGTGKTIAFLLPAIQTRLTHRRDGGISLLVISPTRELAMQIAKEAEALLQRLPQYRVGIAIGGTNKLREEKQILQGCDILIATPGRLIDHMENEDIRILFSTLDTLVLDEADRLLDMGFLPALKDIVRALPDKSKTNRQSMLFSATVPSNVHNVAGLVLSPGYKFISTIPADVANMHERVPQHLIQVPNFSDVTPAMVGAIRAEAATVGPDTFKAIVFAPTAALANFYGHILTRIPGLPETTVLHSHLSQGRRTKVTNDFRAAKNGVIVATDVIARGMDFPDVTTVFQIGIPADRETYIHRLGRTARAGAGGRGIFIISRHEDFVPRWRLQDVSFDKRDADLSAAPQVYTIAEQHIDEEERTKIYRSWLGYYVNWLKHLQWQKDRLVAEGNQFARDALACADTPPIEKNIVSKMGLRGTPGLVVVQNAPKGRQGRGGGGEGRSIGSGGQGGPAVGGGGRGGGGRGSRGGGRGRLGGRGDRRGGAAAEHTT